MSAPTHPDYEVVIGLEVHCQLRTRTKLFTGAPVRYGEAPNQDTSPVCLGLPGALPVLNAHAVELAVRAALATEGEVQPHSIFARKNYFYPDLPKGYQISQYEEPLSLGGFVAIEVPGTGETKRVGLTRIHMEEDAGKSIHEGGLGETHVDLNRAGVPLMEIVSEPELRSPEEAGAYLRALHQIVRWVGASDADMEKGQFRCDANVSLRPHGAAAFGTRTELKNLNSFRYIEEAIHAEVKRQAALLEAGGEVVQETWGWDADAGRAFVMRGKENADDYRYFPDPDLVPLQLDPAAIAAIRDALPELPATRRARFAREFELPADVVQVLTASRELADFFEAAATASRAPRAAANWVARDVQAALRDADLELAGVSATPESVGALIALVEAGRITAKNARDLLGELLREGGDPEALVAERGLETVSDAGELARWVDEALAANPKAVASYADGDRKSLNFLMGQVMRASQGKADPGQVRAMLAARLDGAGQED